MADGTNPLDVQVGGEHYKSMGIQPIEFVIANKLDAFQKDVLKYSTRIKGDKAKRLEDLNKAKHYLELYIDAIESGKWPWNGFVPAQDFLPKEVEIPFDPRKQMGGSLYDPSQLDSLDNA